MASTDALLMDHLLLPPTIRPFALLDLALFTGRVLQLPEQVRIRVQFPLEALLGPATHGNPGMEPVGAFRWSIDMTSWCLM
jgi:hypothetical protein